MQCIMRSFRACSLAAAAVHKNISATQSANPLNRTNFFYPSSLAEKDQNSLGFVTWSVRAERDHNFVELLKLVRELG